MSRAAALTIALLMFAAVGRSLWMSFTAMALATPIHDDAGGNQIERWERYRGLAGGLDGVTRAGYVGHDNPLAREPYYLARLSALPTVLVPSADERVVVVDLYASANAEALLADPTRRVRHRVTEHLLIVERVE